MAVKKTTISQILLTDDIGELVNRLASTGHDKELIILGLDKQGGLRIVSNFLDYYRSYGMLQIAVGLVYDRIIEKKTDGIE